MPVYDLVGGDEVDSNAVDSLSRPGWRLVPFDRYQGTADTFLSIIDGQVHSDMWNTGSADVEQFIATQILAFMQRYVAGDGRVESESQERRRPATQFVIGIGPILPDEIIRVLTIRQYQNLDIKLLRQQMLDGSSSCLDAGAVAVVVDDDPFGESAEQFGLLGCERRT